MQSDYWFEMYQEKIIKIMFVSQLFKSLKFGIFVSSNIDNYTLYCLMIAGDAIALKFLILEKSYAT